MLLCAALGFKMGAELPFVGEASEGVGGGEW